jgi:hypothetical protein
MVARYSIGAGPVGSISHAKRLAANSKTAIARR